MALSRPARSSVRPRSTCTGRSHRRRQASRALVLVLAGPDVAADEVLGQVLHSWLGGGVRVDLEVADVQGHGRFLSMSGTVRHVSDTRLDENSPCSCVPAGQGLYLSGGRYWV